MNNQIKLVTSVDLKTLQAISIATFSDTFGAANSAQDLQEYLVTAYSIKQLRKELENKASYFYFIYVNQTVAGYLKLNTDGAQTEMMDSDSLEIERIYIKPDFKRHGLGQQLYQKAESVARSKNKQIIWLGVWEHNQPALNFYRRLGFTQHGAHVFQLGADQQRDLIMYKQLS